MRRLLAIAAALAVVAVLALWLGGDALRFRALRLAGAWRDPIGPPRAVAWQRGPEAPSAPPGTRPPNVVVILADDLGANDVSLRGGGVAGGAVPTPHIDSIARAGVEFTAGHAGNATCAPSRAALLTGRYATRFGFEFTPAPKQLMRFAAGFERTDLPPPRYHREREAAVPPFEQQGLPPAEITLAELLRPHGYHSVAIGKWHLGESPALHPNAQGFDEFLGFLPGGSLYLPVGDPRGVEARQPLDPIDRFLWAVLPFALRQDGGGRFAPDGYLTDVLAEQAAAAIEANRHRPFFLYLAFNAPHTPLQAARQDYDALAHVADHRERVYGAMIRALDRGVGRVLDALRAHGLERDTLVIFTSDNGGADYVGLPDLNRPYRGWKMTFFAGGLQVPFYAQWPARLPPGVRFDAPVAHVDVFATAAAAAGAPLPADRPIDGVDLVPFVRGEADGRPHEMLYWRSGGYRALLHGDHKLQLSEAPPRTWLFDLARDPGEREDLSATRPDLVGALRARLDALDGEMAAPAWPSLIEAPVAVVRAIGEPPVPGEEIVYWAN